MAQFTQAGAVTLLHNNATKFATDADGVNVTGQVDISTDLNVGDDVSLTSDAAVINLGGDSEVNITHVHNTGVTLNVENSTTNSVTDLLKLQVQSSGTPAVGIGTGIEFSTETAAGTLEIGGIIESVTTGITPTSEEFDMVFKTMSSGATAAERLKLNGSGATIGNINLNANAIISTNTNGNLALTPNGTGDVQLDADTVRVGDSNADVTITTNGTGDLTLNTNAGSSSGVITIADGADGNIAITPNGTGEVDITKVDIDGGAIDGTIIGANSAAASTFSSVTLASGATVTAILDEDNMSSDSNTSLATQQSIKAFVSATVGAASNVTATGITFEGATDNDFETTFAITDPTADRTFTFGDESGTVATTVSASNEATALAIALG